MGTPFTVIYERFLLKVTDFVFLDLCEENAIKFCKGLMMAALAKLKNLEHDLSNLDEENQCFDYILNNTEVEYIASGMVVEWIEPQINNTTLTHHYIGTSDEKFYAPSNQLGQLRGLRDDLIARTKKIHRDYTYMNSGYFTS